jgi:hypothetical protein
MDKTTKEIFEKLNKERFVAIDIIIAESTLSLQEAMLKHDFEMADWTTNRKMLEMIGIVICEKFDADNKTEINKLFDKIITSLKLWKIEVINYFHLTEVERLVELQRILDEPVRMMPPNEYCRMEYIDMERIRTSQDFSSQD